MAEKQTRQLVPYVATIEATYRVVVNVEKHGEMYQVEVRRSTRFNGIDYYMASCIWYAAKMGIKNDIMTWFEQMVERYSLLQGDIYCYDSIEKVVILGIGPKTFGG